MMSRRTRAVVAAVLAVSLLLAGGASVLAGIANGQPKQAEQAESSRPDGQTGDDRPLAALLGVGGGLLLAAGAVAGVRRRARS